MNPRTAIISLVGIVSLAAVWAVLAQRRELNSLRAEQQLQAAQAQSSETQAEPAATDPSANTPADSPTAVSPSSELLRLRADVTRFTHQRQALADVRSENEKLRSQLAARGTNARSGPALPPGYIRKSEARMVGYQTPQDTIQSFLWAIQNRDLTNVLQAFSPAAAEHLTKNSFVRPEAFFEDCAALVGMGVVGQKTLENGSVDLKVEVMPGVPPETIHFEQINGEWKLSGPF